MGGGQVLKKRVTGSRNGRKALPEQTFSQHSRRPREGDNLKEALDLPSIGLSLRRPKKETGKSAGIKTLKINLIKPEPIPAKKLSSRGGLDDNSCSLKLISIEIEWAVRETAASSNVFCRRNGTEGWYLMSSCVSDYPKGRRNLDQHIKSVIRLPALGGRG